MTALEIHPDLLSPFPASGENEKSLSCAKGRISG
jgi:hypothetical protein